MRWEVYMRPRQQQIVRRLSKADDYLRYAFLLIKLLGRISKRYQLSYAGWTKEQCPYDPP